MGGLRSRWFLLLVCGGLAGCRQAPPPASPPAEVDLQSPLEATGTLLDLLCAHLEATGRRDRSAAERLRDQAAIQTVARADVIARYKSLSGHVAQSDNEVLARLVESWAAALEYYAGGLDRAHMRIASLGSQGNKAVVDVPAHGQSGEAATLRVSCLRVADEQWRVMAIEFAFPGGQRTATAPAAAVEQSTSAPATSSAPVVPPKPH